MIVMSKSVDTKKMMGGSMIKRDFDKEVISTIGSEDKDQLIDTTIKIINMREIDR